MPTCCSTPPIFIPAHPTLDNYAAAWNGNNFGQAFFNSVVVATCATVLNVGLASALAFAFARYRFPGRNLLFYGMLATMMVPGLVLDHPAVRAGQPPASDQQPAGPDPGLRRWHGLQRLPAARLLRGAAAGTAGRRLHRRLRRAGAPSSRSPCRWPGRPWPPPPSSRSWATGTSSPGPSPRSTTRSSTPCRSPSSSSRAATPRSGASSSRPRPSRCCRSSSSS